MNIRRSRLPDVLICFLILFASQILPSYAYLDPASGSAVTAAILGFFATIAYVVRKQFYKVVRLFRGKPEAKK